MKRTVQRAYELFSSIRESDQLPWWEWDFVSNRVTASPRKVSVLGYDPSEFIDVGYQAFTELLHPDDYGPAMKAMRAHLDGNADLYEIDYRIRRKDGEYTWYLDRGAILEHSESGEPLLIRGVVLDLGDDLNRISHEEAIVREIRTHLPRAGIQDQVVMCSQCGRLRYGSGQQWTTVGENFQKGFPGAISHTLCNDCIRILYPDSADSIIAQMVEFENL